MKMKKMLLTTLFVLVTLTWAAAQQSGGYPNGSGGQATPPSSQMPGAGQSPNGADRNPSANSTQPGSQAPMPNAQVTEGCLGGSDPHYTITDTTGTTYQLNIPPKADTSKLASHVGESVQVAGNVNSGKSGPSSIDVQGIGRGTGTCSANGPSGAQAPPKR